VTFFITAVASAPFEFDPPAMGFAIQSLRIFGPLGRPKAENLEKLNQLKEDFKKNLQGIDNVSQNNIFIIYNSLFCANTIHITVSISETIFLYWRIC
jgi:hypothetical protein